jgi:hypothetical protein
VQKNDGQLNRPSEPESHSLFSVFSGLKMGTSSDIPIQRFKARETELHDQWRVIFNRESFDLSAANPELKCEAGRKIFNACASLNPAIEGMATPDSYMTRGAFHHLANTPPNEPEVGWHPQFLEMAKAVTPPKQ